MIFSISLFIINQCNIVVDGCVYFVYMQNVFHQEEFNQKHRMKDKDLFLLCGCGSIISLLVVKETPWRLLKLLLLHASLAPTTLNNQNTIFMLPRVWCYYTLGACGYFSNENLIHKLWYVYHPQSANISSKLDFIYRHNDLKIVINS